MISVVLHEHSRKWLPALSLTPEANPVCTCATKRCSQVLRDEEATAAVPGRRTANLASPPPAWPTGSVRSLKKRLAIARICTSGFRNGAPYTFRTTYGAGVPRFREAAQLPVSAGPVFADADSGAAGTESYVRRKRPQPATRSREGYRALPEPSPPPKRLRSGSRMPCQCAAASAPPSGGLGPPLYSGIRAAVRPRRPLPYGEATATGCKM